MQKQLVVMRHAKTEEQSAEKRDHERELLPRGEEDAREIGRILRENGFVADLILCSDASRTVATTKLVKQENRSEAEVFQLRELYHARSADYLSALRTHCGSASRVLVVGHNPTAEEFVTEVSSRGMRMRPGVAALFHLGTAASWETVSVSDCKLRQILTPSQSRG
jgi:phosphohistidine phosphatase